MTQFRHSEIEKVELVPHTTKKKLPLSIAAIIGIFIMLLSCIGVIAAYAIMIQQISDTVYDASHICSSDDIGAEKFEDPDAQHLRVWFYNVSNPYEYFNGQSAELHETGVFSFDLTLNRGDVQYDEDEHTVTYNLFYGLEVKDGASCPDCDPNQEILVYNPGYNALLAQTRNEGLWMLQMQCTLEQIAQYTNASAPICTSAAQTTNCKCCSGDCSAVASPTSKAGGIISWLNKYDHGVKLSSASSAFALSSGAYTQFLKYATPFQLLRGYPSALLGFFSTSSAVSKGDTATLQKNADLTADMKAVCYPLYCPQVETIPFDLAVIQSLSCAGLVPGKEVLMSELGMSEERANELRYLEGAQCDAFTPAVGLAVLQNVGFATVTCAKAGETAPCCPSAFNAAGTPGSGLGCLAYVNGLIVERPVYSNEEAVEFLSPTPQTQHKTGCASDEEKFDQTIWRGESEFNQWFTPASYAYPAMPWADSPIVLGALTGTVPGNMAKNNVTGKQFTFRDGKGITSPFLERQFTDGKPMEKSANVWIPFRRGAVFTVHIGDGDVRDIDVNNFSPNYPLFTDAEEIEASQKLGNVPYQNMQNLVYTLAAKPVIMSLPNFYKSEEITLSQNVNTDRGSASTAGIYLYRTKDGYSKNAADLPSPEVITTATWEEYGDSTYLGKVSVEPATGVTIGGSMVNMMSTYNWNCNPNIDPTCYLFARSTEGGYCYASGNYACSATNIFTPKVQGSKVTPIYWMSLTPDSTYATDRLLQAMDIRFFLSIIVLVVPILCFLILLLILYIELFAQKKSSASQQTPGTKVSGSISSF